MKLQHRILFIAGLVAIGLTWFVLGTRVASASCARSYIVQRGDWLANIARRNNISIGVLYQLNPWLWDQYGGNIIYPGQVLCLPGPAKSSAVAVEINYQYQPDSDETQFNLVARGGFLGKRQVYPIASGDVIETLDAISMTTAVNDAIAKKRPPFLVGIRNQQPEDATYTLVTVNRPAIFDTLRITGTLPVLAPGAECVGASDIKLPETFVSSGVNDVKLKVNLEASDGLFYPFTITKVQALSDGELLARCYTQNSRQAGFALYPIDSNGNLYAIQMVLSEGELGPPGRGWARRCGGWGGRGGWFYRWIYAWYGC